MVKWMMIWTITVKSLTEYYYLVWLIHACIRYTFKFDELKTHFKFDEAQAPTLDDDNITIEDEYEIEDNLNNKDEDEEEDIIHLWIIIFLYCY